MMSVAGGQDNTASGKYRGLRTPPPIGEARNDRKRSNSAVARQVYQVAGEKMLLSFGETWSEKNQSVA